MGNDFIDKMAMELNIKVECGGDGSLLAECAVISDYPGDGEVGQKRPLVGASGRILWDELRKYNYNRNSFYVTNVVKRRQRKNDTPVSREELMCYYRLLTEELRRMPNLKYVLCLGTNPLQYFTDRTHKITEWRGSKLEVEHQGRNLSIFIVNNPAVCFHSPKEEPVLKMDIHKFTRMLDGTLNPPVINAHYNMTMQEVCRAIDRMHDEKVPISYDIETHNQETVCIGIGNTNTDAYVINLIRREGELMYTTSEERIIWRRLQRMFGDPNNRFIAQNGMFDAMWLYYKDRVQVRNTYFDTLLAHHTLYPTLPHNLGFIVAQYTDHSFYKDERTGWKNGEEIDTYWQYNAKDVCLTRICYQRLLDELRTQNMDRFFFDYVMYMFPDILEMSILGVKTDMSLREQIVQDIRDDVHIKLQEFKEAVRIATNDPDIDINPRSPAQLKQLFFSRMKLIGRGTSTDVENRKRMFSHPRTTSEAKDVIIKLDTFLKEDKFRSTYAEARIDPDERYRTEYKQQGVTKAPGRLSSTQTAWGTGGNLQNQPERAYPLFIADDGYAFTYFDGEQAEARIVAFKANISKWKDDFERARLGEDLDCHRSLAAEMFNIPYDQVPKKDRLEDGTVTQRFIAKRCRHGLNYRMQPERLAQTTGLPINEATKAFHKYHRVTPEIQEWWKDTIEEVKRNKMIYNAFGRRWVLMERPTDDALDSIIAFYPQSTLGDKVKLVITQCHNDPEWPKLRNGTKIARISLNIHDALIAVHPDTDEMRQCTRTIMRKYAEEPIPINGEQLIIPASFKHSIPDDHGVHRWSTIQ